MVKLSKKSFRLSREFLYTPPDTPLSSVPNEEYYQTSATNKCSELSDSRDTSDSDTCEREEGPCSVNHDGRFTTSMVVNINIDEMFTMMFTNSQFIKDCFSQRNITEFDVSEEWRRNRQSNLKCRRITFTYPLTGLGPKESFVTETQTMNKCSKPGVRYSVDVVAENIGVPYADSFNVLVHNCLERVSDKTTRLTIYGDVKFKKPVWGMVKGFIEKPTLQNLESHVQSMEKTFRFYAEASTQKRHTRMRKSNVDVEMLPPNIPRHLSQPKVTSFGQKFRVSGLAVLFCLLIIINAQLFLILKKDDTRPCVFRIDGWEDRLREEENLDQMQEYMDIVEQYTAKQREQLLGIRNMLYGEIQALQKTEQAIGKIIEQLKPATTKPRRNSRLRRLIGV